MKEQDIVNTILDYLRIKGAWAIRINSGMTVIQTGGSRRVIRGAPAGTSDIIGLLPGGRFLAIECKVKGNKPTPSQNDFLNGVRERGGLAVVAYSLDDVINAIAQNF